MSPQRDRAWTAAAVALAVVYFGVLWGTAGDVGYTRDEGYYFKAAEEYARWWGVLFSSRFFEAFSDAEIMKHFGYNTEHPPLVKLSLGATYHLLHGALGVASPAQGFRAAGFLWGAVSVFSTYLLGRRLAGPEVGLFAAGALALLPRYFFDAHLACFDVAITAMWTLSLWSFHRAWTSPPGALWRRSLVAGVIFGLALATKLNALFLPFVFVALWWVDPRDALAPRRVRSPGGGPDFLLPPLPIPLLTCAVVGPLVFIATWPYLWHDTFKRIGKYLSFHLRHEHYPISYFHELLVEPPFPIHFPFVMTGITVPAPLVVLGLVGLSWAVWGAARRRLDDALVLLATALPVTLIALPSSPIFGGVKHWYNAMPTAFIAAGVVLISGVRGRPRSVQVAAAALVLAPGLFGIAASHPNGIGYYNAAVGGYRGGAELGMQRGFWGGLAFPAFEALEGVPRPGRVFFNRANYDSYRMYRREALIPDHLGYANEARGVDAGLAFEQPEHGETEADIWSNLGRRPVSGTYQDGVTLTQIYIRGASDRAPELNERAPDGGNPTSPSAR